MKYVTATEVLKKQKDLARAKRRMAQLFKRCMDDVLNLILVEVKKVMEER